MSGTDDETKERLLNDNEGGGDEGEDMMKRAQIQHDVERYKKATGGPSGIMFFPTLYAAVYFAYKTGFVSKAVLILAGCMLFTGLLLHMATKEYPDAGVGTERSTLLERLLTKVVGKTSPASTETMVDMVTKFRVDGGNIRESHLLLSQIKSRLAADPKTAEEALRLGMLKYSLQFAQDKLSSDKRIAVALDIAVTMLSRPGARKMLRDNDSALKETVEMLLAAMQEHMKTDAALEALLALESGDTDAIAVQENAKAMRKMQEKEEEVDIDFTQSSQSGEHDEEPPNQYFLRYGHKFVMALGMLADEHVRAQTIIGDCGGIALTVRCLRRCSKTASIGKWCCWAALNLVYDHPPNKREFFTCGGLLHAITALNVHPTQLDLYQQGLAIILTIIHTDANTKMSLAKARESCLANGIFDMLQNGKKQFADQQAVQDMVKKIFDLLMADWS